ncbi:MAG: hypothetical protein AAFO96_25195, partial [Bacteroidota bacterium]
GTAVTGGRVGRCHTFEPPRRLGGFFIGQFRPIVQRITPLYLDRSTYAKERMATQSGSMLRK